MVRLLSKSRGIEQSRQQRHFQAEVSTGYSSDNAVEIAIRISSPNEVLDFLNGHLLFDMVATTDGTTPTFNNWAASSWIRQLRIEDNGGKQIGKSVNFYNGYVRYQMEMKSNNEANQSYLGRTEGAKAGDSTTQDYAVATTSRQYAHRFQSHIFTANDYFPNMLLNGLRLVITMEAAGNVVKSTSPTTTEYSINNISYVCDVITLKPAAMKEVMGNPKIKINYERVNGRQTPLITGDISNFSIGTMDGPVKSAVWFQILDADRGAALDYWPTFKQNNLSNYRFFLNNKPATDRTIQITATRRAEYLMNFLQAEKMNLEMVIFGAEDLVLDDRFVIAQRFDRANTDLVISSVRDGDNNELTLEATFSSSPAANQSYFYTNLDQELELSTDGSKQFRDVALMPTSERSLSTVST